MFSSGSAYERYMGRWSSRIAPLLVRFAGVRDGDAVLDVGCGTGALSAALAEIVPRCRVVGIDPSAEYVSAALARGLGDRVRFQVGSAMQLPFEPAAFDSALSLLVLNFVPQRAAALREQMRVTRPGGTIAAAVWDYGGDMGMLRTFWDEAVALRPDMDTRDERHMPLCRPGELGALWREHGMEAVAEEALAVEARFSSFDDYWSPFLDKQGPAGAYVASLDTKEREELRMRLRRRLLADRPDGPITLPARAWAVRGTLPSHLA